MSEADKRQVSGDHYKTMSVQPWTLMEAILTREEFIGFLKGNAIKYGMRQGRKEGSDDGGKAQHYLQKLREVQEPRLGRRGHPELVQRKCDVDPLGQFWWFQDAEGDWHQAQEQTNGK
jgi:Protein of unknwon function (DUF3310)